jgi:mannose-6-phosphate isomerase-like protein (cupin superfamily)
MGSPVYRRSPSLSDVETADLRDFVEFEEDGALAREVFASDRLTARVVSVDVNRAYGPAGDPEADAVVVILAGEAVFQVDRRPKRMTQWGSVLVEAGHELVVTNASGEPLVLLLVTAPSTAAAT